MTAEELLADTDLLTTVLTYHVVPGFYTADDILTIIDLVIIKGFTPNQQDTTPSLAEHFK